MNQSYKGFTGDKNPELEVNHSYRSAVLKTWNGSTGKAALTNAALGLTGEAGEVADLVKKHVYHSHELDRTKMITELGDVLFYAEILMNELNVTRHEVEKKNIEKLAARYPSGFNSQDSINRKE